MPIYLFKCTVCSSTFEIQLKISEKLGCCPICYSEKSFFEKLPTRFSTKNNLNISDKSEKLCPDTLKKFQEQPKHEHHASCNKNYIDKMVQNYEKATK
ncbi:MAG: FmdB family zinc ribbon protein [Oligoflexales bacterium]